MDSNYDLKHNIIDLLSRLGVSSLSGYIGKEKLERFHGAGQAFDSYVLAEIIFIERGLNLFKDKNIRLELLASFGADKLRTTLKLEPPIAKSLHNYNDFSWGNNSKSKEYLKLFDLPDDVIFESKVTLVPIENVNVKKSLYSYQNWIRKSINEFLNQRSKNRIIVHMPTGSGKTRTMLEAVCDHIRAQKQSKMTVVWLAHSEELCEQAVESFKLLWSRLGTEDVRVVRLWGGSQPIDFSIDEPTFVVTSFQTANNMFSTNDNNRFAVFNKIRTSCLLMIVDEAHQSTAPTYKDAIELFSNSKTKVVGLTATPGRHHKDADGDQTFELAKFYGNNKINILDDNGNELDDPITYLTNKGVLARINRFQIDSGAEIKLSKSEINYMERLLDIPKSVLNKLGKDAIRTNLIVTQAIKLAIEDNFPTIIFAPSKDNAIEIATLLRLRDVSAAAITADTSRFERRQSIDQFKQGEIPILVNFGVLTTGFDAPNIKAVIVGRPTTSVVLYSQMIGRGLRGSMMGGEDECYLVDVKDNLINMPDTRQAFTYFDEYYSATER